MAKYKRKAKRVFPLRYSSTYINKGQGPSPGWSGEYHKRAVSSGELPNVRGATEPMRARVETLHVLWQSEHYQGIEKLHKIRIAVGRYYELLLYHGTQRFIFVHTNMRNRVQKFSIVYGSRDQAYACYDRNCIRWKNPPIPL